MWDSEILQTHLLFQPYYLVAVWPYANCLTSLNLYSFNHEEQINISPVCLTWVSWDSNKIMDVDRSYKVKASLLPPSKEHNKISGIKTNTPQGGGGPVLWLGQIGKPRWKVTCLQNKICLMEKCEPDIHSFPKSCVLVDMFWLSYSHWQRCLGCPKMCHTHANTHTHILCLFNDINSNFHSLFAKPTKFSDKNKSSYSGFLCKKLPEIPRTLGKCSH